MSKRRTEITSFSGTKLVLDMGMDARDFAQARLTPYMDEEGWIATQKNGSVDFVPWKFSGTQDDEGFVQITGEGFCGRTLLSILNSENTTVTDESIDAVKNVIAAMEKAIENQIDLPNTGPAGTIISGDGKILFLPQTLFVRAAESRQQEDYSNTLGCWINPGLSAVEGVRFTEAIYAYYCIARKLPYPLPYTERRHEDYYDHNFVPLELVAPGVNPDLALVVNRNLSRQGAIRISKKNAKSVRVQNKTFPCKPVPFNLIAKPCPSQEEVQDTTNRYEQFAKKQEKRIKRIRFFRKNNTAIKISFAAAIVVVCIVVGAITRSQEDYTTKGMTSLQVCQALYTGMNNLDIPLLQAVCKGRKTTGFVDSMSTLYVTIKVRENTEHKIRSFVPSQWLYVNDPKYWMIGLTNLEINGNLVQANEIPHIKKEKPIAVTQEDGTTLSDGDTKVCTSSYCFINSSGTETIGVDYCQDTLTLEYKKDRWHVTSIKRNIESTETDLQSFLEQYNATLDKTEGDVLEAVKILKEQYNWLPSNAAMLTAADELYKQFELPAAKKALEQK